MKDEDEHSLKGVEYCEEVRHDDGGFTDEEETERPRESQQKEQSKGTHDPGSTTTRRKKQTRRRSVRDTVNVSSNSRICSKTKLNQRSFVSMKK